MKTSIQSIIGISLFLFTSLSTSAGNKDRIGQSGGNELLINPWTRSSGMAGANTASAVGLEAANLNVAGIAFTRKTEILFANTSWMSGADISINSFGLTQRLGEAGGVLGLAITSMDFGDIPVTTVNQPEGGLGTFSPQFLNMGLSYAKGFSETIYGGMTLRTISESIANASARGVALDAGVKYVTGVNDQMKFGIALRNVGPKMQFSGDGFNEKVQIDDNEYTIEHRRATFELPSILNIGASYDFYLDLKEDTTGEDRILADHRITAAGNFMANSFGKDQIQLGVEYGFKSYFMGRAGYVYEEGITSATERTNALTGLTFGLSFQVPFGKNTKLGLDYSYRTANPFSGTHSIGARITI